MLYFGFLRRGKTAERIRLGPRERATHIRRRRQDLKPGLHYWEASALATASPLLPRSFFSLAPYWHFVLISIKSELTEWTFSFFFIQFHEEKVKQKKENVSEQCFVFFSRLLFKVSTTCFVVLLSSSLLLLLLLSSLLLLLLLLLLFSLWYVNVTTSWFKACRLYVPRQ